LTFFWVGLISDSGVRIDPKREDNEYGRFAWIYDPDGQPDRAVGTAAAGQVPVLIREVLAKDPIRQFLHAAHKEIRRR
jgi:hypothetical protein